MALSEEKQGKAISFQRRPIG